MGQSIQRAIARSSLQELFRCHTDAAFAASREMTLIAKAGLGRNLPNAQLAVEQQVLGSIQPTLHHILVRRDSHALLEQPRKMVGTDVGDRRHVIQG